MNNAITRAQEVMVGTHADTELDPRWFWVHAAADPDTAEILKQIA